MSDFNGIPDFLQDLEDSTSKRKFSKVTSELKVINMRSNKNWGKIFIVPIDGDSKGEGAIKQLNRVARVEKWVSGTKQDGSEYGFVQKLFFFLDPKYYGDLTEAQATQLDRMKSKFNQVNNGENKGVGIHQFTLIQGLVVQHKDRSTPVSKIVNDNVPALVMFESRNFEKSFRKTITDMADKLKGYNWLTEMCNRATERKRYLEIDFYLDQKEGAGFQVTTKLGKFDEDAMDLTGGTIGLDLSQREEGFFDKFKDPIKAWLSIDQSKPRFNEDYMNEIEVILNNLIKGESTVETRKPSSNNEVTVPDSNSGFVAQDENEPIPTNLGESPIEQQTPVHNDEGNGDLPF